jgi:hypothetical protein
VAERFLASGRSLITSLADTLRVMYYWVGDLSWTPVAFFLFSIPSLTLSICNHNNVFVLLTKLWRCLTGSVVEPGPKHPRSSISGEVSNITTFLSRLCLNCLSIFYAVFFDSREASPIFIKLGFYKGKFCGKTYFKICD